MVTPADVVYAVDDCVTKHPDTGIIIRLRRFEPWMRNHPLVRARPHLFTDDPALPARPVEQASRAPGEKRTVRRGTN